MEKISIKIDVKSVTKKIREKKQGRERLVLVKIHAAVYNLAVWGQQSCILKK